MPLSALRHPAPVAMILLLVAGSPPALSQDRAKPPVAPSPATESANRPALQPATEPAPAPLARPTEAGAKPAAKAARQSLPPDAPAGAPPTPPPTTADAPEAVGGEPAAATSQSTDTGPKPGTETETTANPDAAPPAPAAAGADPTEPKHVTEPAGPDPTPPQGEAVTTTETPPPPKPPTTVSISSQGGAYGAAQAIAVIAPFANARSVEVTALSSSEAANADVVELDAVQLAKACDAGELAVLDATRLKPAPDGTAATEDFLPGGLTRCGAATFAWSSVVAVRPSAFKKAPPKSLADVFNTSRYPGVRALPSGPRYLLEMALMADDVPPNEVYAQLATDDGVERAFRKLAALGDNVVWTERRTDAMELLISGKAAIAAAYSGRAFFEIARGAPIELIWPGQIYNVVYLAVRKASAAPELADELLAFATAPEQLARQATHMPYGPMRRSAIPLVGPHATLAIPLVKYLPTAPDNLADGLMMDNGWWLANEARLATQLKDWRESRKQAAKAD